MEVDDQKYKDENVIPDGIEDIFRNKRIYQLNQAFRSKESKLFKKAILVSIVLLTTIYFLLPSSYVSIISISGNQLLSSDYIKEISHIGKTRRFYLTFPFIVEYRLEKNPFISSAHVSLENENRILIQLEEKKAIGYRYDGEEPYVLFTDGSKAKLESEYLDIIAEIPLITGFESDKETKKLCNAFKDVDVSIIRNLSDVQQYALPYDNETIKILTRTGIYFLSSYRDLSLVNDYQTVYSQMSDRNKCIYAFSSDTGNTIYTKTCPWDEVETNKEYWTDENGNIIVNTYGDQVVKHYYTDANGNDALDASGNKIAIPIDENGLEVVDEDFQAHYEAGYYASGVLVMQ